MNFLAYSESEFPNVRVIDRNGEPWFVGKDVCQAFGDKNHNRSLSRVDEDDRMMAEVEDAKGRTQSAVIINESGLYALLFSMTPQKTNRDGVSDAYPIAVHERIDKIRRFKRWVTSEVLPSIRRNGLYAADELLNNPDLMISVLTKLKEERAAKEALQEENKYLTSRNTELSEEVMVKDQQIAGMRPKVYYYNVVLNCKDLLPISVIAKDYGWSAIQMNNYLKSRKIQYKQGDIWLLYQKYAKSGYTSTKTTYYAGSDGRNHITVHTYWTQKGRMFLYDLLREDNIFPLMEQEQFEQEALQAVMES